MAERTFWKGYLKLSLVTCPVAMSPATTESERVRFHTVNAATGNRVVSRNIDSGTGRPVREEDEARGYQHGDHAFVVLEDADLDSIALESTRTIDLRMFVPAHSIGWIWYDRPHYLVPDDTMAEEAFAVIRDAMEVTGTVGIGRLVLYRRERAVMLEPRGTGIVLWTLRYGDEVRPATDYPFPDSQDPDPGLLELMVRLIRARQRPWSPDLVSDPVQERLREIIATKARRAPRPPKRSEPSAPPGADNVVSILDALRRSLSQEKRLRR